MKYAVIKIYEKQFKITSGDILLLEKINGQKGKELSFNEVLLLKNNDNVIIGCPYIKGASVKAKIIDQGKDKKVRVTKFKAKSRYRKTMGHRQQKTKVEILKIIFKG